jgi:hypothetical protein
MERERNSSDTDGLTEVWRLAEQRRAEDLNAWLSSFVSTFLARRRLMAEANTNSYPAGRPRTV